MNSIRRRLTLNLTLSLVVLFAATGTALHVYTRHALVSQFDGNLLDKARTFVAWSQMEGAGEIELDFTEFALEEFRPSPKAEYYQVWDEGGRVMARSDSLAGGDLVRMDAGPAGPQVRDLPLPDGRAGRAVALRFAPHSEDGLPAEAAAAPAAGYFLTLVMARSREDLDQTLGVLFSGFVVTGLLMLGSAALLVRWAVRRGLQPLERVAKEAASINASRLDHRFATEDVPEELLPICTRLNGLLERLEGAFRRERRFTADAAHELRTPIAELRSLAEVGLQSIPDTVQEHDLRRYFEDALSIALQMEHLVKNLLAIARCEAGLQTVRRQRVDLAGLVRETWQPFAEEARARHLAVDLVLPVRADVETDRTLMAAILSNLFANAVTYTPDRGAIGLEVTEEDGALRVTVSNSNDQLTREDLEHIFEPFWRKDKARSDPGHDGVGLVLVAAYANLLDATIDATFPSSDVFRVSLRHPRETQRAFHSG